MSCRKIKVLSFGYKNGPPPRADLLFNVRFIANPFHQPGLRDRNGCCPRVEAFVMEQACVQRMLPALRALIISAVLEFLNRGGDNFEEITIAFGCAGGRQRSVVLAGWCAMTLSQWLGETESSKSLPVEVIHRDIDVVD